MADPKKNTAAKLLHEWWGHRGSLGISVAIMLVASGIYIATFVGERPMPVFDSISKLELNTLDVRFQLRGRVSPDPRIIIVDIDQRSQEQLGRWPFPRINFAHLMDALRGDGARVVAFDMTFSKPDQTVLPLQDLSADLTAQKKQGLKITPSVQSAIDRREKQYNYDEQFADSLKHFGNVVLGSYFLYTTADLQGVSNESLNNYANLLAYFSFPQVVGYPPGLGEAGRVHVIHLYENQYLVPRGAEANAPDFTTAVASEKGGAGFFNVTVDADSVVRRLPLAIPYGRDPNPANWDFYPSLDVQTIRLFLGLRDEDMKLNYGDAGITTLQFGSHLTVHPDDLSRLLVNFHGPSQTYPYVSFGDVALNKFPRGTFKDKIVLIGASATGIGDLRATPFGGIDFPGVEIHANLIDNILNQQFLVHHAPQVLTDLGFIFLFGLPLGLWLAVVRPRWMAAGLLLLVPFTAIVYGAFLHGWWLNFIVPALFTLIPNVSFVALYRVFFEEQEKRKIRGAFQQYVSPEVIRRLLTDPERVQPRKTEVTVLFSDIRGFTTISEKLDAQQLASLLNAYLTDMTKIIFRHQGTLDKYIGDAVMAIWGAPFDAPDHAEKCCAAAVHMLSKLTELQKDWRARGFPELDIGIGINTGIASVGNMGSSLRYGYTAMGDSVNLASRLEGLNKEYGTRIVISESTRNQIHSKDLLFRELDLIRVKGKLQPVTIFEVLSANAAANAGNELVALFGRGRTAYKAQDWPTAKSIFQEILVRWPDDVPARIFLTRCDEYLAAKPAEDWDGVYQMKHK